MVVFLVLLFLDSVESLSVKDAGIETNTIVLKKINEPLDWEHREEDDAYFPVVDNGLLKYSPVLHSLRKHQFYRLPRDRKRGQRGILRLRKRFEERKNLKNPERTKERKTKERKTRGKIGGKTRNIGITMGLVKAGEDVLIEWGHWDQVITMIHTR